MNSPIIVFNPSGLTDEQVKQVKQALDDAYRAGYETAKEFYKLKFNPAETTKNPGTTWIGTPNTYGVVYNDCSQQGTHTTADDTYPNAGRSDCPHMYVNNKYRALGICGLCGISFDEWHG